MIDSNRFAERWTFALAVVSLTEAALALIWLPKPIPRDVPDFCLLMLYSIWGELLKKRLQGLGILPKIWQRFVLEMAILLPLVFVYYHFHSGPYVTAAVFLVLQIPFVAMRRRISDSAMAPELDET